jgi:hypothetical protein
MRKPLIQQPSTLHLLVIWIVILVLILAAILLVVHLRAQAGAQTLFPPRQPNHFSSLCAMQQKSAGSLEGAG